MSHSASLFSSVGDLYLGAIFCDHLKAGDASGDVYIATNMYSRQQARDSHVLPRTRVPHLDATNEIA